MTFLHPVLLGAGLLLPAVDPPADAGPEITAPTEATAENAAQLREMLHDRRHPRNQSQAALLLVQAKWPEAEEIVRQGLKQTDSAEVFLSLATALRLCKDNRFTDELFAALVVGKPAFRQAAAESLAVLADAALLLRLQTLAEETHADLSMRQAALWTLGHTGRKAAVAILLEQLNSSEEVLRHTAADALRDLSGLHLDDDQAGWRAWWQTHKDLPNERWLEERLAYQSSRARRVESDLDRARAQLVQLHQQLYARLPAADRIGHVQGLAENDDPAIRALAVSWAAELLTGADRVGTEALADLLLRVCHDGSLAVQRPAVLALGRVNDPRALARLRGLLKHGTAPVRAAAAHALAQQALSRLSASGVDPELARPGQDLLQQVVPLLQKALDDPALEVVLAAAEDLGTLGVPEAGPVLMGLLHHNSESVRQTAAQALERVADSKVLDGLLAGLDDTAVTVRFGLVGAIGRASTEGPALSELQRARLIARLEELLLRDADPGVRSRAANVLGRCGPPAEIAFLWRRVTSREDSRVQEKAWAAMIDILARSMSLDLLRQWDHTLSEPTHGPRRLQMLTELCDRWKRNDDARPLVTPATEMLVQALLDQGKWTPAFPLVRELLAQPGSDADVDRRLRWLLAVGERALAEGNPDEARHAVHEAQPFLARSSGLAVDFELLEKRAHP